MNYVAMVALVFLTLTQSMLAQETADEAVASTTTKAALVLDVQETSEESSKRVTVNVQPNDGAQSVSGTADVVGFPFIQEGSWGDIDWKVDGSKVTGVIVAKDGRTLGAFEGTITATGLSGKFTHVDGRVGLWSWDGPPPR